MSKAFRKQSKRLSCKKKYKIEKKIKEHHRKVKKVARKNTKKHIRPKDPGVPNEAPFKDQVLKEVEERRIKAEELLQKQKMERKYLMMKNRDLSSVAQEAEEKMKLFEKIQEEEAIIKTPKLPPDNQTSYIKEFRKVVEASDVILQVLDARDPLGTRCKDVEECIINSSPDKKIVFVLNKIDLVPRENLLKWLSYLKNFYPALPFKASTQMQNTNLSRCKLRYKQAQKEVENTPTSRCVGAEALMKLLGNYSRSQDIRKTITVGVVGFPNVGKSSLINSLKRRRVCNTGGIPGITKHKQEIHLGQHIKLLDSPGIVLAASTANISINQLTILSFKEPSEIEEEHKIVQAILQRANKEQLMRFYGLPNFETPKEFLVLLAKRYGYLKKGAALNFSLAKTKLMRDWNTGKIKYFTCPPETIEDSSVHQKAEIVDTFSEAFDLDALFKEELSELPDVLPSQTVAVESRSMLPAKEVNSELRSLVTKIIRINNPDYVEPEEDKMETGEENKLVVEFPERKSKIKNQIPGDKSNDPPKVMGALGLKKQFKKQKKQSAKLAKKLSDSLVSSFASLGKAGEESDALYDFNKDFVTSK